MGQFFDVTRTRHALATNADSITIDVPAGRKLKVHGVTAIGGESAAAASAEVGVYRVTTLGSGGTPTSLPVRPLDPGVSVPSGFTAKHTYGTQPVFSGADADPVIRVGFQPFGGQGCWPPVAGAPAEFWSATAYQVSVRGIDSTGTDTPQAILSILAELE